MAEQSPAQAPRGKLMLRLENEVMFKVHSMGEGDVHRRQGSPHPVEGGSMVGVGLL